MKRLLLLTPFLAVLALAGCGGTHHSAVHHSFGGSVHPPGWGGTPKGYQLPAPLLTATPTGTMFDAVTVGNIPGHPFAVAGYTAGLFPTWPHLLADFPSAHHISIAISVLFHAMCADAEPGDLTPGQTGPWALADIRAGFRVPCVYADLSEMPAVKASLASSLGSNWRGRVLLWLAWYRFIPGLVSGYDAVQYSDKCLGRSLDCSTVTLAFLRIAQPPYVAPRPKPTPKPKPGCDKRCHQARALAATRRAIASVEHGLAANHCRHPYRRAKCRQLGHLVPILIQRERWFAARVAGR